MIDRILQFAAERGGGDVHHPTSVPGLAMVQTRAPTQLLHTVFAPVFCLVLQGEKQIIAGPRTVAFGRGESLIVSLDLPGLSRITRASLAEPYVALALELDPLLLRDLAAEMPALPCANAQAIAAAPADAEIAGAMERLFGLMAKPRAIPVLAPLITREIHFWLLSSAHGAMLRNLALADSRAAGIARAIAEIRQDIATTQPVATLARIAGMSASAFHDHFRTITGTTPLQFQKQLKLAEARRLIRDGGLSVSGTAFAVGYESPTQFSRDYARLFGAPPQRDRDKAAWPVPAPAATIT
ncbi:AraC family transcriptional regulator [Frigidibacter albus]|nr:AraC family transcriptional regulator [Frigidibacter albus]